MKKILLGTTTLVGAAVLFAGAASAETPKVTVGGFIDFQVGIMSDDQDANRRNHAFRNDTELSFKVDGKSDNGLGYGAEIWLEADVDSDASDSSDTDNQGVNASKTFIYVEGGWGRMEGGSNLGPDATMKVDGSSIARATGGIDGDFRYFINGTANVPYIATPDLPLNYGASSGISNVGTGDESQENLNKITYYTPRWHGLQLGLSYIPSDQERGQLTTDGSRADNTGAITLGSTDTISLSQADSIWVGAIRYDGKFDQVGFSLAATGNAGDAELNTNEDLRAWNVGAKVSFMGFSIAGSYGDWGDSLRVKTANLDDNDYWTAGAAYEYGPFGVSVTYLKSNIEVSSTTDNEFDNLSVGADYKLAPGFTPYAEVSFFEGDAATGVTNDNDGTIFIIGSQLAF
jgi:outer membrane protein OmpU